VRRPAPDQLVPALEPGVRAEAEVAEPARELGELLARHVRVALPAEVGRAEVFLTGQERDPGFTEDVHVRRLQPQSVISASREAPPPSEGALPGVLKAPPKYRAGVGLSRPGPWAPRLRGQRSGAVPVAEPARVGAALARPGLWPQDVRGLRAVSIRRVAVAE